MRSTKDLQLPLFKLSGYEASLLMSDNVGLSQTDLNRLQLCKERKESKERGEKVNYTDAMKRDYELFSAQEGIYKLNDSHKKYLKSWLKRQALFYDRRKKFYGVAMEKGTDTEQDGLLYYFQNKCAGAPWDAGEFQTALPENEWVHGYTDHKYTETREICVYSAPKPLIYNKEFVILTEHKGSFDQDSFPLFEDKVDPKYYAQVQVYMKSYVDAGIPVEAKVIHTLMSAPAHIINKTARTWSYERGLAGEIPEELLQEAVQYLTYDDLEPELRIKEYPIEFDRDYSKEIELRVGLARKYLKELVLTRYPHLINNMINYENIII